MQEIPPIGDAIFYPTDPEATADETERLITATPVDFQLTSLPAAVLSPHAAYESAGAVMGAAYHSARGLDPARIIIIAPLHADILAEDAAVRLELFLPHAEQFRCAGALIPIDVHAVDEITGMLPYAARRSSYFSEEPAIELQLPFLHNLYPGIPVIPLFAGNRSAGGARNLVPLITRYADGKTLFVCTSNATAHLPAEAAADHAAMSHRLLTGEESRSPFAPETRHASSMCGIHILEAFRKSRIFAQWHILARGASLPVPGSERETHFISGALPGLPQP